MKPIVFINSHPIQYFVPLYREILELSKVDLTVWYLSNESLVGDFDPGFGQSVKWNIPLLDGYKSRFIKNNSLKPSIYNGFWGLVNFSIIPMLFRQKKSIVIVSGWAFSTYVLAIVFGKFFGHTICLRVETPFNQEVQKGKLLIITKKYCLKLLFLFIDKFLFIGYQNKLFYKSLGIKERDLIFTPYSVDNNRFRDFFTSSNKNLVKEMLKLPLNKRIILFSGKYIEKKRPIDLLEAFHQLNDDNAYLIMLGDGELRLEMESFILRHGLMEKVLLTGFINQSEIPLYYRAADIFVMCSGMGETWGLSVNEAMNFGIPVIISDTCGSSFDLVENGVNGAVFKTGNIIQLRDFLNEYLNLPKDKIKLIETAALDKISYYSYTPFINAILNMVSDE
jgi:glycosyltransferase involved in cell wall biosynthesis